MAQGYLFNKASQCMQHVCQCLTQAGFGKEYNEIHGVPLVQRHTDFGVVFETTYSRPMPGAWINDNDRWLVWIDTVFPTIVANFSNPQQSVVDWGLEMACVENGFVLEVE